MKTDLNLTTSSSHKAHPKGAELKDRPAKDQIGKKPLVSEAKAPTPDFTLELSSKAETPSPPVPSAPKLEVPAPKELASREVKNEVASELMRREAPRSVKKDAVIFITGLGIFSSPSKSEGAYAGVGRMAESVKGARLYGWDQKAEILEEVKKVHPDYKVILVGHSLGGDTAIEVANELDSLEGGFRSVDLLVTLDAFGMGNGIVPQNVKEHLNVFGENDLFLNDGPHVARRHEKTRVENVLSSKDHTEIDDDKEIQYDVMGRIQKTLGVVS